MCKQIITLFLVFFVWNNACGILIRKNDITIDYEQYIQLRRDLAPFSFIASSAGLPHFISIKNNSQKSIAISSLLIKNNPLDFAVVLKALQAQYRNIILTSSSATAILMLFSHITSVKGSPLEDDAASWACKVTGCVSAALAGIFFYKWMTGYPTEQQLLQLPFTIAPGEKIQRIFWTKDSSIELNVEAIEPIP